MRLRSLGALPRLCLPVGQLTRACQLTARAPVPPPGAPADWLTRFRSWLVRARTCQLVCASLSADLPLVRLRLCTPCPPVPSPLLVRPLARARIPTLWCLKTPKVCVITLARLCFQNVHAVYLG